MVMIQDTFMIMVLIEHVKGLQIRFDNASQPFSSSVACACPGDQLLFDCSVADGVATIWRGKALNCHGVSNSIILRHSRFNLSEPAAGECNDRIVAHSIGVSDTFISQLSVNVTEEMNNKTIECVRDANGTTDGYEIAGTTTVAVVTAEYSSESLVYSKDTRLEVLAVNRSHLTLQLPRVNIMILLCPTFNEYVIHSSNCGRCPNKANINETTVLCDISDSDSVRYYHHGDFRDTVCTFEAVTKVQCESTDLPVNASTDSAERITVNLRVPNPPKFVNSSAIYQDGTWSVQTLFVCNKDDVFNISEGIDGSPTSFTITYSDQTANMICGQDTIPAAMFCEWNTKCIHEFNISSPNSCSSSTAIIVSTFATNLLGNGPEVQFEVVLAGYDTGGGVQDGASDQGFPRNFNASSASVIIVAVVIITCVVLMIALAIVITFVAVRKNKTRSSRQPNANIYTIVRANSNQSEVPTLHTASIDNLQTISGENISDKLQGCIYADVSLKSTSKYLGAQHIAMLDDKVQYAEIKHPVHPAVHDKQDKLDRNINLDMLLIQLKPQVTPKWYQFGLAVGIAKEVMDKYSDYPDEECLVEVLDHWLRNHESNKLTWKEVAEVLREIDLHQLADDLTKSYDTGQLPIQVDMDNSL